MKTKHVDELIGAIDRSLPWFLSEPDANVYLTGPWLLLDMETTNLDFGDAMNPDNRMVCAAWTTNTSTKIHYCRGAEFEQKDLLAAVQDIIDRKGFIIAHNAKFELHWLSRMGIDLYSVLTYDTMLGEYVRGGNRWMYQHLSLDKLNRKYGGIGKMKIVDALIKGGICPSTIPDDLLKARVCKDVADTFVVFKHQRRILQERGQLQVAYTRNILTPCLTWIEQRGIGLCTERVEEEYQEAYHAMARLSKEMDEFTGGINWRSPKQKAAFIYDTLKFNELKWPSGKPKRTKSGARATDDKTLTALSARTKRQAKFVELMKETAKANAALTKTLEFFKGVSDEYNGVFYGSFNQFNTQTHRLSSSGKKLPFKQFLMKNGKPKEKSVQFQNFPRRFKDLMQPKREGWKMGEADGSQLEFRVATWHGQDRQGMWNIRHDVDQHTFTAQIIGGYSPEDWEKLEQDVQKYLRQEGKPDTFKPLYGGTKGTKEQERYYKWFQEEFSDTYEAQTDWTLKVLRDKKLTMPWGLTFYWPNTRMSHDGYIDNTPSIFNYPVQALATSEIIPVALVYLWQRLRANGAETEIVNTVHDSAIAEVAPGEEALWKRLSIQTFTLDVYTYLEEVYGIQFNVPLGAGITTGSRWSSKDSVEEEYNVEPTGEYWMKGERKAA